MLSVACKEENIEDELDETEILPATDDKTVLNLMPEIALNKIDFLSKFYIVFENCTCAATKNRDLDTELSHALIATCLPSAILNIDSRARGEESGTHKIHIECD